MRTVRSSPSLLPPGCGAGHDESEIKRPSNSTVLRDLLQEITDQVRFGVEQRVLCEQRIGAVEYLRGDGLEVIGGNNEVPMRRAARCISDAAEQLTDSPIIAHPVASALHPTL